MQENRVEAIEYKKEDSQCRMEKNGENIQPKCIVTLKNYRNHSQALKVVLYDNANENSKAIQYRNQSIYKNMRQSNLNFKFLFLIIEVLKR